MEAETTQSESFDVYKFLGWLHVNRKQVVIAAIAVAVLGAGFGIFSWKKGQTESNANDQLFALPAVFGASEKAVHPTPEALLKVAQEYPSTSAGEQSQLLAAGEFFAAGKYNEAHNEFTKFVTEHSQSPLVAQANLGVAASLEAQGKTPEAIQKYQSVITSHPTENVASPAKLTLARLYEQQNKPKEALEYYEQIIKGAPNQYNPWASEANERKNTLIAKHPELDKSIISSFSVTTPSDSSASNSPAPANAPKAVETPAPAPKATPPPAATTPK